MCALYLASNGFRFDNEEFAPEQRSEARSRTRKLLEDTPRYLIRSQALGGGFGSNSFETHCAYTFCALGSLRMLGKLYSKDFIAQINLDDCVNYLLNRQTEYGGFNGRPNKHVDGCYSYWVCASLRILGKETLIDTDTFSDFVMNCCQDEDGQGLRDKPDVEPDSYHTCYVLGGYLCATGQMEAPECNRMAF